MTIRFAALFAAFAKIRFRTSKLTSYPSLLSVAVIILPSWSTQLCLRIPFDVALLLLVWAARE